MNKKVSIIAIIAPETIYKIFLIIGPLMVLIKKLIMKPIVILPTAKMTGIWNGGYKIRAKQVSIYASRDVKSISFRGDLSRSSFIMMVAVNSPKYIVAIVP